MILRFENLLVPCTIAIAITGIYIISMKGERRAINLKKVIPIFILWLYVGIVFFITLFPIDISGSGSYYSSEDYINYSNSVYNY